MIDGDLQLYTAVEPKLDTWLRISVWLFQFWYYVLGGVALAVVATIFIVKKVRS